MLKDTNNLSDLLNIKYQKNDFDELVQTIQGIVKKESGIELKKENISIKNNILKIKASSSIKFVILLHLSKINLEIKSLEKGLSLEL